MSISKMNDLKEQIYGCKCERCRAVVWLVEDCGARLQFSPIRGGRLCELAVVAAAGSAGMLPEEIVTARRDYAKHLRITLSGPTSNAENPNHIEWTIENSNHNPDARNRVNLGRARASFTGGRYRLR